MQLEGFSLSMSQSGTLHALGGGGAGKATATGVHTTLGTSGQLVQLSSDLTSGKIVPSVEIEVYRAGQEQQLVEQFYFEDVLVTGLQTSGSSGGTGHSLSFDYTAFNRGHLTQDAKGAVGPAAEDGFDFQKVIDADGIGPAIHGDAIKAKLENVDSLDTSLQYYVSWEGSGGWLQLGSFSVGETQAGSTAAGGGGGAGKAIASDLHFTLGASAQLLQLEDALTSGKHLKALEIEAYHSGGKGQELVDQYVFEDLLVTSLQTSNAAFNSVSVEFAKFSRGHVEFDEKGAKSATTEAGWDFEHNVQFHAPVDSDLF
jgi:type VI secretion system secreted protein Hcp